MYPGRLAASSFRVAPWKGRVEPRPGWRGRPKVLVSFRGSIELLGVPKLTSGLRHNSAEKNTLGAGLGHQIGVAKWIVRAVPS